MKVYKHLKLKKEIIQTLYWFAEMDIKMCGYISESTKQAFEMQGIEVPILENTN